MALPLQLILVLLICTFFGHLIPLPAKEVAYSLSLSIQEVLVFFLPWIVFSYLFACIIEMKRGAAAFIGLLLTCVIASNFFSAWIAYGTGIWVAKQFLAFGIKPWGEGGANPLEPYWSFALVKWISNDQALFAGLLGGLVFGYRPSDKIKKVAEKLKWVSQWGLSHLFIPIVPVFVFGFAIKLQHEGTLVRLFSVYGPVFLLIGLVELAYLGLLYFVGARGKLSIWVKFIRNVLPSILTGFSTLSSAASLPMTLKAAEENTEKPDLSRAVIPATVNIHLMGDSIAIPLSAFVILVTFGMPLPSLQEYFIFAIYFVLAKFAIAAVPGGGIVVMLPVLAKYLHFSPEMLSLITAIYILFDPLITSCNVAGNGAFVILFSKLYSWIFFQPVTRPFSKKTARSECTFQE